MNKSNFVRLLGLFSILILVAGVLIMAGCGDENSGDVGDGGDGGNGSTARASELLTEANQLTAAAVPSLTEARMLLLLAGSQVSDQALTQLCPDPAFLTVQEQKGRAAQVNLTSAQVLFERAAPQIEQAKTKVEQAAALPGLNDNLKIFLDLRVSELQATLELIASTKELTATVLADINLVQQETLALLASLEAEVNANKEELIRIQAEIDAQVALNTADINAVVTLPDQIDILVEGETTLQLPQIATEVEIAAPMVEVP